MSNIIFYTLFRYLDNFTYNLLICLVNNMLYIKNYFFSAMIFEIEILNLKNTQNQF